MIKRVLVTRLDFMCWDWGLRICTIYQYNMRCMVQKGHNALKGTFLLDKMM